MGSRLTTVLAVALILVAGAGCADGSGAVPRALVTAPRATPVVFVHGYASGRCPGTDVARAVWGDAILELTRAGWGAPLLPVSYYACDSDGVDITGWGPHAPRSASARITPGQPRVRYDQNTSIERLAHDLGWFVYDRFSRDGTPVDLVGASMGGLVMRDLLYRVARHDPRYPPYLLVPRAVTLSTPHRGLGTLAGDAALCGGRTLECEQFATDSPFIARLSASAQDPQSRGGTAWTLLGSGAGCDLVPVASSLGMTGTQRVDYLSPCYDHGGYLRDTDPAADASVQVTAPDGATLRWAAAPRSLAWLLRALLSTRG